MDIREEMTSTEHPLNDRQAMQYKLSEALVETYGMYNQSHDSDGAHYMPVSPFSADGMVCSNCVAYEGPRACHLVEGDIDPNGLCKLWVIPEDLMVGAEMYSDEETQVRGVPVSIGYRALLLRQDRKPAGSSGGGQFAGKTGGGGAVASGAGGAGGGYSDASGAEEAKATVGALNSDRSLPADEVAGAYTAVEVEERLVAGRTFEMRATPTAITATADSDDMPMTFRGYAALFNSPSQPLPFIETIKPGAFKRSLNSGKEIRMYLNHDSNKILASTRSGTLRLTEDSRGLMVEADIPPTSYGKDVSILMQRGDVHSMSFGFTVPNAGDSWSGDGRSRELREVILHEVSVVTGFPAYQATEGQATINP